MKMIDIVETLVSEGHQVKYRHRTDGGIIITSIDGKKFGSLTEGNKTARSMVVGGELSFARAEQVSYNVKKYIKLKEGEHKAKGQIDETLNKTLKRVQARWRTLNVKGQGRISKKKLRWYIKTEGKKKAMEYLLGRERYALGYANESNVNYLIQRIRRLEVNPANKKFFRQIEALIEDIEKIKDKFKEEWIEPVNAIVYRSDFPLEDKIKKIREIIGIQE